MKVLLHSSGNSAIQHLKLLRSPHFLSLLLAFASSVLLSPANARSQCYTRTWSEPEMVTPTTLQRDYPPYRLIRTADDSLRVVWAEGSGAARDYHLLWSAYENPGWTKTKAIFGIDYSIRENYPHLSKGDDGTIAMTYVRTPAGASEGDLMLSILYPDSLVWSDPIVIRSPVAWGMYPVVANVNADSLWVFFNRGVRLRAKPVFHGAPGGEYIFDNLDGGTYAWTPDILRTTDGTIWVFWSPGYVEQPLRRLQYITLGPAGFTAPQYVESQASASDVDAIEFGSNQIWIAYGAEDPVPPGDGSHELRTRFWNGSTWSIEYWIAGNEDVKRDCLFGRFAIDGDGKLLLIYGCEPLDNLNYKFDLYATSWDGSTWCPREKLNLPDKPDSWERSFQEVALDSSGQPVTIYGYGVSRPYNLYSTRLDISVPALVPHVLLRGAGAGTFEATLDEHFTGPTWFLTVYGRRTNEGQWDRLTSIATEQGQETYPITGVDTYGALRVDLYDLTTGETVAQSNVLERNTVVSREPILWSRMADGTIQFCRNNAVTPRAMSGAIYDLAGRKVAELPDFQATSQLCAEWPGTDSRGRSVASGVYMARFVSKEAGRDRMHVLRVMVRH